MRSKRLLRRLLQLLLLLTGEGLYLGDNTFDNCRSGSLQASRDVGHLVLRDNVFTATCS